MNPKVRAVGLRGVLVCAAALLVFAAGPVSMAAAERETPGLTPLVMFPAFHFTKLRVTVHNQVAAPDCPASGSFEDWFQNDHPSATFSQVCQDKLLTLRFDASAGGKPFRERFSNQRGVRVEIIDYGRTDSAPFYEAMYARLEAAGYQRDRNIRVAGYDSRLTPDMGDFLGRTRRLIEDTFRDNGNRPVHLAGHSNGPLYAQYLLTHTSQAWRDKFIHGFTPIAGNFPGQGGVYLLNFTGLNIIDFTFPTTHDNAESSARMYLSAPSTYMSSADPNIFDSKEIVIQDASTGRSYTPSDFPSLFRDAGLADAGRIAEHYIGFVEFADRAHFPQVDVFAEKGSGIDTVVGVRLPNLSVGQVVDANTQFFTRDGDINQEDLTNEAVGVWSQMRCFHFSLTDSPGVNHFELPSNAALLTRLVSTLALPRSDC
jgi:lecithin-cholesterol acyltransferase